MAKGVEVLNTASWIAILIITLLFIAVVIKLIINKKCNKGKCSGCPISGICHSGKE